VSKGVVMPLDNPLKFLLEHGDAIITLRRSSSASYRSTHAYQSDFLGPTSICKSQVDASLCPEASW